MIMSTELSIDCIRAPLGWIMVQREAISPLIPFGQNSAFFIVLIAGIIGALLIYSHHLRRKIRGLTDRNKKDAPGYEKQPQSIHEKEIDALAKLASPLSHDLNNLVGSIMGYASLLKKKLQPGTKEFHYVDIIENSSKQMTELVKRTLGFSQLDTRSVELVDLVQFTRNVVEYFGKDHPEKKWTFTISETSRPTKVQISTTQFRQVILAILENAADSMEGGGIISCTIGLSEGLETNADFPEGSHECYLEIQDHGTGMEENIRERIFEPFFTTKRREKYTGLSLSQAFNVVKKHNGYISVSSTPGNGTRVRVHLPLDMGKNVSIAGASLTQMNDMRGTRILVVDDEENVRQLGFDILSEHGFNVVTANNGADALKKLRENPDTRLVIMDMIMPVMNGKDACIEIKKMKDPPKILICTGFSELSDLKTVLGKYAESMIQKPYSTGELVTAVEYLLKDNQTPKP